MKELILESIKNKAFGGKIIERIISDNLLKSKNLSSALPLNNAISSYTDSCYCDGGYNDSNHSDCHSDCYSDHK